MNGRATLIAIRIAEIMILSKNCEIISFIGPKILFWKKYPDDVILGAKQEDMSKI